MSNLTSEEKKIETFKTVILKNIDNFYNNFENSKSQLNYYLSQMLDENSDNNDDTFKNLDSLHFKFNLIENTIEMLTENNLSVNELTILNEFINKYNLNKIIEFIENEEK